MMVCLPKVAYTVAEKHMRDVLYILYQEKWGGGEVHWNNLCDKVLTAIIITPHKQWLHMGASMALHPL
jgi:hypothetical protein